MSIFKLHFVVLGFQYISKGLAGQVFGLGVGVIRQLDHIGADFMQGANPSRLEHVPTLVELYQPRPSLAKQRRRAEVVERIRSLSLHQAISCGPIDTYCFHCRSRSYPPDYKLRH